MRCVSCDVILTDFEATRKSAESEQYLDLCNHCYSFIRDEVKAIERHDLMRIEDIVDSEDDPC